MKFRDFVTLQRGFDLPKTKMCKGLFPVVGSTSIIGYHNEFKVNPPGVVIGRSGSLGTIQYVNEPFWPHNTSLWVKDFKGNDPRFVFYRFHGFNFANFNSGAGVPTLNRNHLDGIEVEVTPLPIQRRIASVLSAYDDLIENNTRRIKILEQMAQTIYREWFVEFRFPGHEKDKFIESPLGKLPQGWEAKNLFEVAEVTYGFPFKSKQFSAESRGLPVIRIRDIQSNSSSTYTEEIAEQKYIVNNGDILVGMDGDFHMGKWAGGKGWLNQRVVRFRTKTRLGRYHLFLSLEKPIHHFDSTIVGTTVAHLSDRDLRATVVPIPPLSSINMVSELLEPLFDLELNLRLKNAYLRRTRDLLLPKFISGELEVL